MGQLEGIPMVVAPVATESPYAWPGTQSQMTCTMRPHAISIISLHVVWHSALLLALLAAESPDILSVALRSTPHGSAGTPLPRSHPDVLRLSESVHSLVSGRGPLYLPLQESCMLKTCVGHGSVVTAPSTRPAVMRARVEHVSLFLGFLFLDLISVHCCPAMSTPRCQAQALPVYVRMRLLL